MWFANIHIIINKSSHPEADSASGRGLRGHRVDLIAKELPGCVPACVQPVWRLATEMALHDGRSAR